MVIEKVFGLKATSISLNERFATYAMQAELAARIREAKKREAILLANLRPNEVCGVSTFNQVPTQNFNTNRRQVARRSRPFMRRGVVRGVGRGSFAAGQQRNQSWYERARSQIRLLAAQERSQVTSRGRTSYRGLVRGRGRGRGRGIGRGGQLRPAQNTDREPAVPSKEQLDHELEQYMSTSKSVLDRQLDEYMSEACNRIDIY